MKPLKYILITAVFLGSLLSPVSASLQKNKAFAGQYDISFTLNVTSVNDQSAQVSINIKPGPTYGSASGTELFGLEWSDTATNFSDEPKIQSYLDLQNASQSWNLWDTGGTNNSTYSDLANYPNGKTITFNIVKNLLPDKDYSLRIEGFQFSANDTFEKSRILTQASFKTASLGQGPNISGSTGVQDTSDNLPACGVTFGFGSGSVYGCIIQVFYYAFWMPTSFLAGLAGKLLDYFIFYSISSSSYNAASGFIANGWAVVRDIANIGFIFVLLYIAISTILDLGNVNAKKMISWVVIIALLINFSLFFTRVIVDSGNILAGVLYNNIGAVNQKDGQSAAIGKGAAGEEQVSLALVDKFDPQKIIASAGVTTQAQAESIKTSYLVVIILATLVNIFMITTFLSVMFLFVGRVVGLMISMIFSPFAFISVAVPPIAKHMQRWSWNSWLGELMSMTLMAPIFIFFLWLILLFLNVGILKDMGAKLTASGGSFGNFVAVLAPFIIIIGLLDQAKKLAKSMAGEIGQTINNYAGQAIGFLGGAALGGAAIAGRGYIGAVSKTVAESRTLKQAELEGGVTGFAARQLRNIGRAGSTASYDFRATAAGEKFASATGFALGSAGGRGGYEAQVESEKKRQLENLERLKMKGTEAAEQDRRANSWKSEYENDKRIAQDYSKERGIEFKEAEFKEKYVSGQDLSALGLANKKGAAEVRSSKEANADIEKAFIARLKRGTGIAAAVGESLEKASPVLGKTVETGIKAAAVATVVPGAAGLMSQRGEERAAFELEQKQEKARVETEQKQERAEKTKGEVQAKVDKIKLAEEKVSKDLEKTSKRFDEATARLAKLSEIKSRHAGTNDAETKRNIDEKINENTRNLQPIAQSISSLEKTLTLLKPGQAGYEAIQKKIATETIRKALIEKDIQDLRDVKNYDEVEKEADKLDSRKGDLLEKQVKLVEQREKIEEKLKPEEKKEASGGDNKK
jgi:hypothetical protein